MTDPVRRRLRAPQEDGTALIDPPLSQAGAIIARNQRVLAEFDRLAGLPAGTRRTARACLLEATLPFEQVKSQPINPDRPLILAGHQPELFHPGVWLKNFVISSIARTVNGTAINLAIDNDVIRTTSTRVASGSLSAPYLVDIPFDGPANGIPWEERPIVDIQVLRAFPRRVQQAIHPLLGTWKHALIVDQLWPHVERSVEDEQQQIRNLAEEMGRRFPPPPGFSIDNAVSQLVKLGDCLTKARHCYEREVGLVTKEARLSSLCWLPVFFDFVSLLFTRHEEFHLVYNAALHEYRVVNHIRSRSHPVPDLACDGDWYEMPFWIWLDRDPRRRRVFVRSRGKHWEVSDGKELTLSQADCTWSNNGPSLFVRGIKLRPRALVTTMFARLLLSDLFIHGIGGAKYDELTDLIIGRFFGIDPPGYMTATATFRLPIERPQVTPDDVRRAVQRIRDVRYRPESFLRDTRVVQDAQLAQQLESLAAEKREFLARHNFRRCEKEVFDQLDRMNRAMHDLLRPIEEQLRAEHAERAAQLKRSQLLAQREFSFVLFPAEILPARLLDLSKFPP